MDNDSSTFGLSAVRGLNRTAGILCCYVVCLFAPVSPAQTAGSGANGGGDTPTGFSGSFSGSLVTGGGSFDPYERNASRSVTDMVVPGAVIPFTYTRIWNSRGGYFFNPIWAQWRDNWLWEIKVNELTELPAGHTDPNEMFLGYKIAYPDGRVITVSKPAGNSHAPERAPGTYVALTGVVDRFVIQSDTIHGQLYLSDGSVVNFDMSTNKATGITDKFGQTVSFAYSNTLGRTITEPAGRWIRVGIIEGSGTNQHTMTVTSSLGQRVNYEMDYATSGTIAYQPPNSPSPPDPNGANILTSLATVTYNDILDAVTHQPIEAHYVYKKVQPPDFSPNHLNPPPPVYRLIWASDPMFDGPLHRIKYLYVDHPYDSNGDATLDAVLEERWAANYGDAGVLVTRVEMLPNTSGPAGYSVGYWTRRETRGDGPIRTISYLNTATSTGQVLADHITDFTNNPSHVELRSYDWTHRFQTPIQITDMRGNTTAQTLESILGNITGVTHPQGTFADGTTAFSASSTIYTYTVNAWGCPNFSDSGIG